MPADPGGWSKGLSFPAYSHLESKPCPGYPKKTCGLEGTVLDLLSNGVDPASGQLSPGLAPDACLTECNGTACPQTGNGWTEESLKKFLVFLDSKGVRTVTLWFSNALQLYDDSFTCPFFMPTLHDWATGKAGFTS